MSKLDQSHSTFALLELIKEGQDNTLWGVFDRRYRPIIEGVAQRLGLQGADAADLAQDVLVEFVRSRKAGNFELHRGKLRAWFRRVAHARVVDLRRRRAYLQDARGDTVLAELSDPDRFSQVWELECRARMLEVALRRLRRSGGVEAKTVEAFEQFALAGKPAEQVARELSLSVQSVYNAKHRCAARLKEILLDLEELYREGPAG